MPRTIRYALAIAAAILLPLTILPAAPASAASTHYTFFTLRSDLNPHLCLEEPPGSQDGWRVQMFTCHNGWIQQWREENGRFINRQTGRCLEILNINPNEGGYVGVWGCWGGANQGWSWSNYLISGGREIRSHLNQHLCMEIRDSWTHPGGYVGTWGCWGGAATAWRKYYV